jgi:FAD/FMN-containing dehydrogenase
VLAATVRAAGHGERVLPARHVRPQLRVGRGELDLQAFDALASRHGETVMRSSAYAARDVAHNRLAQVKAKYDPDNAFHHNKNIRPG